MTWQILQFTHFTSTYLQQHVHFEIKGINRHAWAQACIPTTQRSSSFKFHLLSFRRSVQDYKIHMDFR